MRGEAVPHFGLRFVQVHHERRVELVDQPAQPHEGFAPDRIGRMRREAGQDQRVAPVLVPEPRRPVEVLIRIGRPRRARIDDGCADHNAQVQFAREARDRLGEEIHVGEAGDAGREHFRHGEPRAAPHELRVDAAPLERPDGLVEPLHQRAADRHMAKEAHRGVGMRIDEPGQQHVGGSHESLARREAAGQRVGGTHPDDPAAVDRDRRVLEHGNVVHRQRPAGLDEKVDRLHGQKYIRRPALAGGSSVDAPPVEGAPIAPPAACCRLRKRREREAATPLSRGTWPNSRRSVNSSPLSGIASITMTIAITHASRSRG